MTAAVLRGNARTIPLADNTVDLVVTSPPYFALRSYQDGGEHYDGQIGSEPTPAEFVAALVEVTRECVRVLKPSGSLFVNLGDSYAGAKPAPVKNGRAERERRPRVEQFTREDAAWLAGVVDSDGSIGIHINKQAEGRSPSYVPWVRIGQMRPEVVRRAAEICGTGKVMLDGRGVWNWSASAQQARWVLERIHPWLLIKKRQAWAAIEVARHVEERNAKGSWRQLTADDVAYRQRLREAVMAWNKGKDDACPVPDPGQVSLPIYPLAPRAKSLQDIPHAYSQACVGYLGLILRAEIIWSKPNGLPESVTDRVRRSHESWFHFVLQPRYFSAVDEIREPHTGGSNYGRRDGKPPPGGKIERMIAIGDHGGNYGGTNPDMFNPLGKLPGSVWVVPTEPLTVPEHVGVDHFAAFPTEWSRRIIQGWSPSGVCTACGEGRRPVVEKDYLSEPTGYESKGRWGLKGQSEDTPLPTRMGDGSRVEITGYACACPEPTAPTTPAVVLDPFGGTGTVALVAAALGRHGITLDMSADYCRLAQWRTSDPKQLAKAARKPFIPPREQVNGQLDLWEALA